MLLRAHTLSLITTYRCTATCDHCCFNCSPQNLAAIPVDRMRAYIEQATEVPSIRVVVFTGGECFLLGADLDALVKAAADLGYVTRFVSNAYWATSRQAARRRLERLQRAGLKEANYSTGEQHARFVPPGNVRHAAIAAAELGLASLVVVDAFGESKFDLEAFLDDAEFQRHISKGTLVLKISPWMRFEGKRHLTYTEQYLDKMTQSRGAGTGCMTALKVLGVDPAEDLSVCCGLTLEEIPEMKIGSLRRHTIKELLTAAKDDFVKIWIALQGPDAVLRYARKLDPRIPVPRRYAHSCEVCRYVYAHPRIRRVVMRNPPPNMRELITQYVQGLAMPMGDVNSKFSVRALAGSTSLAQLKQLHRDSLFASQCV